MKRYYVANEHNIPLHYQPDNGYTYLQAICRVQREMDECVKLFGGRPQDYIDSFTVLDNHFHEIKTAKLDF